MDRDDIIRKIKACLALGKSSNEHEAAAALRQAQKMMQAHGITDFDIDTADIEEASAKAGAASKPALWENNLAGKAADAFGCVLIFATGFERGNWLFIGAGPTPEIARYAFDVLYRQAKRARSAHIKAALKRCKIANRTRRADLFSEGWVQTATSLLEAFTDSADRRATIAGYIEHKYKTEPLKATDRNAGRNISEREFDDVTAGRHAGRDARLERGVGFAQPDALLGPDQ